VPAFRVAVPHALGHEAALVRVHQFLGEMRLKHADKLSDVRGDWTENRLDFRFIASALTIQGTLVVGNDAVEVFGPLPLAATFFRGKIEQTIRQELEQLLGQEM
jgi:hypothetical protein